MLLAAAAVLVVFIQIKVTNQHRGETERLAHLAVAVQSR
jgi:hypothetical protein